MGGGAWGRTSSRGRPGSWRGSLREERLHEGVELRYELQGCFLAISSLGEIFLQLLLVLFLHQGYLVRREGILRLLDLLGWRLIVVGVVIIVSVSVICNKVVTSGWRERETSLMATVATHIYKTTN